MSSFDVQGQGHLPDLFAFAKANLSSKEAKQVIQQYRDNKYTHEQIKQLVEDVLKSLTDSKGPKEAKDITSKYKPLLKANNELENRASKLGTTFLQRMSRSSQQLRPAVNEEEPSNKERPPEPVTRPLGQKVATAIVNYEIEGINTTKKLLEQAKDHPVELLLNDMTRSVEKMGLDKEYVSQQIQEVMDKLPDHAEKLTALKASWDRAHMAEMAAWHIANFEDGFRTKRLEKYLNELSPESKQNLFDVVNMVAKRHNLTKDEVSRHIQEAIDTFPKYSKTLKDLKQKWDAS